MNGGLKVAYSVRAIPSGLVVRGDEHVARVVVVLTPAPAIANGGTSLEDWPEHAHKILDELNGIRFRPRPGEAVPAEGTMELAGKPAGADRSSAASYLWKRLMGESAPDWHLLYNTWICRRSPPDPSPDQKTEVPFELYMPNGLAGLALPYARARRALDMIAGPESVLASRGEVRPLARSLSAVGRPWLGEPDALEELASLGVRSQSLGELRRLGPPNPWGSLASRVRGRVDIPDDAAFYLRQIDSHELAKAALGHDGQDMLPVFDRLHALHHAGLTAVEDKATELDLFVTHPSSRATKRILHLMSSPSLMRLFGFARDYEVKLPAMGGGDDVFLQMSVNLDKWKDATGPWTAAKYRVPARRRSGTFSAVSRDEWNDLPAALERDGVRLLPQEGKAADWYGLISIEPALGLQADMHIQKVQRDDRQLTADTKADPAVSLRSGGIALTRRRREVSTPNNPSSMCEAPPSELFAEDIHQFDRLDVGIEVNGSSGPTTKWRSTTNRVLTHGGLAELPEQAPSGWIDDFVNNLLGDDLAKRRHEIDATQTIESALQGATAQGECEVKDERVAMWVGESGSIPFDAVDYDRAKPAEQRGRMETIGFDDGPLPLVYTSKLPAKGMNGFGLGDLLPILRFGWRYRVGMRRVYLGGACLPLSEAAKVYGERDDQCIPPSSNKKDAFPNLRHEQIAAPEIYLAPSEPVFDDTQREANLDARLQSAERAVLVTWRKPPPTRRRVQSTARIMLVPRVPFEFAQLHESFDGHATVDTRVPGDDEKNPDKTYRGSRPADGLTRVKFFDPKRKPVTIDENDEPEAIAQKPARFEMLQGGPEYRSAPYYPDPAASFLVLRLRRLGSEDDWLDEAPLVIPVQRVGRHGTWPDLLPVHVELRTAPDRAIDGRGDEAPALMSGATTLRHLDRSGNFVEEGPDTVAMSSVAVSLAPGEQVSLAAWYVPAIEDLDGWFDLCRTITILAQAEARKDGRKVGDAEACRIGLEQLLGPERCVRGSQSPVAAALHQHMLQAPLPVVADVRNIDLIHAIDQPAAAPRFVVAPSRTPMAPASDPDKHFPHFSPAKFARRRDSSGVAAHAFLSRRRRNDDWSNDSEDGGRHLVVGGVVRIEAASTGGVVIKATGPGLNGQKLDDPEYKPQPYDGVLTPAKHKAGFAVLPDGRPEFAKGETVEMLRVDGVPPPGSAGGGRGPGITQRWVEIELANPAGYREVAAKPPDQSSDKTDAPPTDAAAATPSRTMTSPTLRAAVTQVLRDGGARWLRLSATAIARHRSLLALDLRPDDERSRSEPLPDVPEQGLRDGEPGHPLEGWVPATERPAPCFSPRLVVMKQPVDRTPSVRRRTGAAQSIQQTFQPFLRLYLDRPWFTSGEGELLGIAHWPPVHPQSAESGDLSSAEFLRTLIPEDLGPLGQHVCTWGRNTRRVWHGPGDGDKPLGAGAFVPPGAITAVAPFVLDPPRNVLMPLPGTGSGPGDEVLVPVAVTTVAPRFDLEEDRWYVDLQVNAGSAPDPFLRLAVVRYQPNAREDRFTGGVYSGIRCSLPAAASVWVRSPRDIAAIAQRARYGGQDVVNLTISLKGPMGLRPEKPATSAHDDSVARLPMPAVRIQLWRTRGSEDQPVIDVAGNEAIWQSWDRGSSEVPPPGVRGPDFWTTIFTVPRATIDRNSSYRVVVEEGETMPDVYDKDDTNDLQFGLVRMIASLDCTETVTLA